MACSTPHNSTTAERAGKRNENNRRRKHAEAQERYRQKNSEALREQARLQMRKQRAAIKADPALKQWARDQRREVDADYRERQRQKKWIRHFGMQNFEKFYLPLYRIHGNQTGKLEFELESKAACAERLKLERAQQS